uniref:hypothetical protein n=1 Tax=Cronobacter malonaticus TaxID=413503 RepID=UPI001F2A3E34
HVDAVENHQRIALGAAAGREKPFHHQPKQFLGGRHVDAVENHQRIALGAAAGREKPFHHQPKQFLGG